MINQFLLQITEETSFSFYSAFGDLRWPVYVAMLLLFSNRFFSTKKQKIFLWVVFFLAHEWGGIIPPNLARMTDGVFPRNNMGVALLFFLLIAAAAAYMLKFPVLTSLDAVTPVFILGRGVGIIGCLFVGCCHGLPAAWGIYSKVAETTTFPTVLLDMLVSYAIIAYLLHLARKSNYSGDGTVTATGLMLFGVLRVVIDVLRDNNKLISVLTMEGIFGILYVMAGWIIWRRIRAKKEVI